MCVFWVKCEIFAGSCALRAAAGAPFPSLELSLSETASNNVYRPGDTLIVDLLLSNTGDQGGYYPFLDVFLHAGPNGQPLLAYQSLTIFGLPLSTVEHTLHTFPAPQVIVNPVDSTTTVIEESCKAHKYADSAEADLMVCGRHGDLWLSVSLPFPVLKPQDLKVQAKLIVTVPESAKQGAELPLYLRAGFWGGRDSKINPLEDPSVVPTPSPRPAEWSLGARAVIVSVFKAEFEFNKEKTATGPSFPVVGTIKLDVSKGSTLRHVVLSSSVPTAFAVLSVTPTKGPTPSQVTLPSASNRTLALLYDAVSGGAAAGNEVEVEVRFYVPQVDSVGAPVLSVQTGNSRTQAQVVTVSGYLDETAPSSSSSSSAPSSISLSDTLVLHSILIWEDVALVAGKDHGNNGVSAKDTLEHALTVQVSDYFSFHNMVLQSKIEDGQVLDRTYAPTLTRGTYSASFLEGRDLVVDTTKQPMDGSTQLTFQTLGVVPSGDGTLRGPITSLQVKYRTVVLEDYFVQGSRPQKAVSQGQTLNSNTVLRAQIVDHKVVNAVVPLQLNQPQPDSDSAQALVAITPPSMTFTLYAIDGQVCSPLPCNQLLVGAGSKLTFRMEYSLPSTDYEPLKFTLYNPPRVEPITSFNANPTAALPAAGTAQRGPSDTYLTVATNPNIPIFSNDADTLRLDYGLHSEPQSVTTKIDILYTVTVDDAPYRGIYYAFSAVGFSQEGTYAGVSSRGIWIRQPYLNVQKGIVASSQTDTIFDSIPTFPVDTSTSSCPRLSGTTLTSELLAASSSVVNSRAKEVEGGVVLKFVILLENTGSSQAFDVAVKDVIPIGMKVPASGLGLCVSTGDRVPVPYSGNLFSNAGIQLTDSSVSLAAVSNYDSADSSRAGKNIILITYYLEVDSSSAEIGSTVESSATLLSYAAMEGGRNYISSLNLALFDSSSLTLKYPVLDWELYSTSLPETSLTQLTSITPDLGVGEDASFRGTATFPKGVASSCGFLAKMPLAPGKLQVTAASLISKGADITLASNSAGVAVFSDTNSDGMNDLARFSFGTCNILGSNNTLVFQVDTFVPDVTSNKAAVGLSTTASLLFAAVTEGSAGTWTKSLNTEIVEPLLNIAHAASATSNKDAGDELIFTITITHQTASNSAAFGIVLSDPLPTSLAYVPGSLSVTSTSATAAASVTNNILSLELDKIVLGETVTVVLKANIVNDVQVSSKITNLASLSWRSARDRTANKARSYSGSKSVVVTLRSPTITTDGYATSLSTTTDPRVTIGEEITYQVVVRVPEGRASLLVETILPTTSGGNTLAYVAGSSIELVSYGALIGGNEFTIQQTSTTTFAMNFPSITNLPDNVQNTADLITLRFKARVTDVTANKEGFVIPAVTGRVTSRVLGTGATLGTATDTTANDITYIIIEPVVVLTKAHNRTTSPPEAGESVRYTATISVASVMAASSLVITDGLHRSLLLVEGSVLVTPPLQGQAITYNAASNTLQVTADMAAPGVYTLQYDAKVAQSTIVGALISNTISGSHKSCTTATCTTGARGYTTSSSASFSTKEPAVLSMAIASTSIAATTADKGKSTSVEDLAVGETVTTRAVLLFPKGTNEISLDWTFTDGTAGMGKLRLLNWRIINQDPNVRVLSSQSSTYRLLIQLEPFVNQAQVQLELETVALVEDDTANINERGLKDTLVVSFPSGTRLISRSVLMEVVEPNLTLNKVGNRSANVEAGDVILYTLSLAHSAATSSAAAYDLQLVDNISTAGDVRLVPGSVRVKLNQNNAPVTIQKGNGANDQDVQINISTFLLQQSALELMYEAMATNAAVVGSLVDNQATMRWDSSPNQQETTSGSGLFATGRAASISSMYAFRMNAPTLVSNQMVYSDLAETSGNIVNVGETVRFNVTIRCPPGTTNRLAFTYTLPNATSTNTGALRLLSAELASKGNKLTLNGMTQTNSDSNGDGIFDTVVFAFASILNSIDVQEDANLQGSQLVFSIQALVLDHATNIVGVSLKSNAAVTYDNTAFGATTISMQTVGPVTELLSVAEPLLAMSFTASKSSGDSGDLIRFTTTISHSGSSSTAYDLVLSDQLDDALTLLPATITIAGIGVTAATVNSASSANGDVRVQLGSFLPSATLVVTFDCQVSNVAKIDSSLSSRMLLEYRSAPQATTTGIGRVSTLLSTTRTFSTPAATILRSLRNTSLSETPGSFLNIGELVTFQTVIGLPEGTTTGLVVTDSLPISPGKLAFIAASVEYGDNVRGSLDTASAVPATVTIFTTDSNTDGVLDQVTFRFGTIVNHFDNVLSSADNVIVVLRAIVLDVAANMAGISLTSPASMTHDTIRAASLKQSSVGISLREPLLEITNYQSNVTVGDAGDAIRFTAAFRHTTASTSTAYNVRFQQPLLSSQLVLVVGSVQLSCSSSTVVSGNAAGDSHVETHISTFTSGLCTISYDCVISESAYTDMGFSTSTSLSYDSSPSVDTVTHHSISPRKRILSSSSLSVSTPPITYFHRVVNTSLTETSGEVVNIGEIVTFEITVVLPEGTTPDLQVTDVLTNSMSNIPGKLRLIHAGVVLGASITTTPTTPSPQSQVGDADGDGIQDSVLFSLGTLVNRPDNTNDAGDTVKLIVMAVAESDLINQNGLALESKATLATGTGLRKETSSHVAIVEPKLSISYTSDKKKGDAGDTINFTVRIKHQSQTSTSAAYKVELVDPLHVHLGLIEDSVTSSYPNYVLLSNEDGGGLKLRIPVYPLDSEEVVITYSTVVLDSAPASGIIPTQPLLTFYSSPPNETQTLPVGGDSSNFIPIPRVNTVQPAILVFSINSPSISFDLVSSSLSETGPLSLMNVGEVATFHININLTEGTTHNLTARLFLPSGDSSRVENPSLGKMKLLSAVARMSARVTTSGPVRHGDGASMAVDSSGGDGIEDAFKFDFGDAIFAAHPNNQLQSQQIRIIVRAVILDEPPNQPGTELRPSLLFGFTYGEAGEFIEYPMNTNPYVQVAEPSLQLFRYQQVLASSVNNERSTKEERPTVDAGDIIGYVLEVAHVMDLRPSSSAAYRLEVMDVLHPSMKVMADSTSVVYTNDGSLPSFSNGTTTDGKVEEYPGHVEVVADSDSILLVRIDNFPNPYLAEPSRHQRLFVKYQVQMEESAQIETILRTGRATLRYFSSTSSFADGEQLPSRKFSTVSGTTELQLPRPLITLKRDVDAQAQSDGLPSADGLTIGQSVSFTVTATLPEGTLNDCAVYVNGIADTFDGDAAGKLQVLSGSLILLGGSVRVQEGVNETVLVDQDGDGFFDGIRFAFGTCINQPDNVVDANDDLQLRVWMMVPNLATTNSRDTPLRASSMLSYDYDETAVPASEAADLTDIAIVIIPDAPARASNVAVYRTIIVEPIITLVKSGYVNPQGTNDIFYRLLLHHDPLLSASPAYNLVIEDRIPDTALTLKAGSVMVTSSLAASGNTSPFSIVTGNGVNDNYIRVHFPFLPKQEESIAINFTCAVSTTVHPGVGIHNYASLQFNSMPKGGRLYNLLSNDAELLLNLPQLSSFEIVGTSIQETPASIAEALLNVGEAVTFQALVKLPEKLLRKATEKLVLTVETNPLAGGKLSVLSSRVVSLGQAITSPLLSVGDYAVHSDANGDGHNDTAIFDFGSYQHSQDGVTDEQDFIIVRVTAIVPDVPENKDGVVITIRSTLDFTLNMKQRSLQVRIVEPQLVILDNSKDLSVGDAGDMVNYVYRVGHVQEESTSAAFDVLLHNFVDYRQGVILPDSVRVEPASALNPSITFLSFTSRATTSANTTRREQEDESTIHPQMLITIPVLPVGQVASIHFSIRLADQVEPSSNVSQRALLTWDSSPSNSFVLVEADFFTAEHVMEIATGGKPGIAEEKSSIIAISDSFLSLFVDGTTLKEEEGAAVDSWGVTFGEQVNYRMRVTLPEGRTSAVVAVAALLDPALSLPEDVFLAYTIATSSDDILCSSPAEESASEQNSWITVHCSQVKHLARVLLTNETVTGETEEEDRAGVPNQNLDDNVIQHKERLLVFDFGTVWNWNRDNNSPDWLEVEYTVFVVNNASLNYHGKGISNRCFWMSNFQLLGPGPSIRRLGIGHQHQPEVRLSPQTTLVFNPDHILSSTTYSPGAALGGCPRAGHLIVTIFHDQASDSTAFDVVFEEHFPTGVTLVDGSLLHLSGVAPAHFYISQNASLPPNRTVVASFPTLAPGQQSQFRFSLKIVPPNPKELPDSSSSLDNSLPSSSASDDGLE
ncbi:hypothetical protein QOT17_006393 [Balamuthia mandrillaris]